MTIPVSTVDAVKDYLFAQITAQINDTTVLVCYDPPGTFQEDDLVAIGHDVTVTTGPHAFVGSGGAGWLMESYVLSLTVNVFRGGDNATTVWKRAKVLSDAVDTVVRTDPTLGGVVQQAYPSLAQYTSGWSEDHSGRVTQVDKEITVEAVI